MNHHSTSLEKVQGALNGVALVGVIGAGMWGLATVVGLILKALGVA